MARLRYAPPLATSRSDQVVLVLFSMLIAACVIAGIFFRSDLGLFYGAVGVVYLTYQLIKCRRGVLADAVGLHSPMRRVLPWDRVRAIEEPSQFQPELVLRCTDGTRRATLLPIEYAEELSRISGKPIKSERDLARPLPAVEVHKTRAQEQVDFAARVARFKARNAELLNEDPHSETPQR